VEGACTRIVVRAVADSFNICCKFSYCNAIDFCTYSRLIIQAYIVTKKASGHYTYRQWSLYVPTVVTMYRQWSLYVPIVVTICTGSGHSTYR